MIFWILSAFIGGENKNAMPRNRTSRVASVKSRLKARLEEGLHRPGDRFPSAREVAARFGISYQTAHRLLGELSEEGLLERRAQSGTFAPGRATFYDGAHLAFSPRARREGSFGARLLEQLRRKLAGSGVKVRVEFVDAGTVWKPRRGFFPVLWEVTWPIEARRPALLLNERPAPGLSASWLDSVSVDDFSGGAGAAQLLLRAAPSNERLAVVAGPQNDARSTLRVQGFRSICPQATLVSANGWFGEDGFRVAAQALEAGRDGVFCANDRLAAAIRAWALEHERSVPPMVGFDDAPVAEEIGLTTMAIPWDELVAGAASLLKRRLNGDAGAGHQLLLSPRPVWRMGSRSGEGIRLK